jgi:ABC-type bacteriocin/lantibiotic exporter with double-glycine peptidase domain
MNLIYILIEEFFKEEWVYAVGILTTSVLLTLIRANGLSTTISKLITALQKGDKLVSYEMLKWFAFVTALYVSFYHLYKIFQTKLLTKMRQWMRQQVLNILLLRNNENMSSINFTKLSSPINRLSTTSFTIVSDWLSYILPNLMFLLLMAIYFLYTNRSLGMLFILGNALIVSYFLFNIKNMNDSNHVYENSVHETENYMQEILYKIDKIVYRVQVHNEIRALGEKTGKTIGAAYDFYSNASFHGTVLYIISNITVVGLMWKLVSLHFAGDMTVSALITFITILTMYRENVMTLVTQISDALECQGRVNSVLENVAGLGDITNIPKINDDKVDDLEHIISIKYEGVKSAHTGTKEINAEIRPVGGKIIGIRGDSGSGKTTMIKMLLKMIPITSGRITVNGKDLNDISSAQIRKMVTYVDQKGKLFDRSIEENIVYGCEEEKECEKEVYRVIKRKERMSKMIKKEGEGLGERWSGGERQVYNVVSGVINPSRILVLDEPTNAVDGELKTELLSMIEANRKKKECIIIISHDKEVFPLFDETIQV